MVALLGAAFGVQAAGVGKLSVYSAIGQPLNAEVALTATPEELNSLTARLASHEAFKEAGIDFAPVLTGLRFNIAKSTGGQPILRLTTDVPLNEPFLHFLVELNWTSGRMVREYTFLLDPPEMLKAAKPASVVKPVTPAIEVAPLPPQPAKADKAAKAAPPAAAPSAKTPPKAAAAEPGEEVRVKPGDTLSKIAKEHMPESVTLDQMLVALFNSNREVFDGSNMNRLRSGKILRLPDPAEAAKVAPDEARQLVVSQAVDFNAYKRRLAAAAAAAPSPEAAPQQQVAGRIKPQVEEKAPPAPAKDKLEVSRTETSKAAKADAGKAALEEELVARDKALREASDRIAHLEKNLESLKQLAELKSESGAKIQQQAQAAAAPAVEKKPAPVPVKPAEPAPPAAQPAPPATEPSPPAQKPAEPAPEAAKEPPPKPVLKKAAPPPPPPSEPSFIEDNPELVLGGGGLIALLLGYLGFSAWRKKKQAQQVEAEFHEPPSGMRFEAEKPAEPSVAPSVVASKAIEDSEVSILGDFSSTEGALSAEGGVDPVAEADVLMAYGRDAQAEEILLEGLKVDPQHSGIHAKLLELYANRQDKTKFESVARDLHGISNGQGEAWDNAVRLAAGLGISGSVFGAAAAAQQAFEESAKAEPAPVIAEAEPAPPVASQQTPAAAPPEEAEAASLDFDLDLGTTTSMPAAIAAAEKAAAVAASEAAASLDFDFDLGTPEPAAEAEQAHAPVAEPLPAGEPGDSNVIDFALDVGELSVPPVAEPEPAEAAADANVLDFDLDLGSIEPGEGAASPEASAAVPALNLADISLDLDAPEVASEAEAALPDIDLDLGLDIGEPEVAVQSTHSVEMPAGEAALGAEATAAEEADDPEVATKLELAQAYEEMGDHEGARELLNEVLNEGSAGQQELARSRLDRLNV
jgi:pilus assembly protein FimV